MQKISNKTKDNLYSAVSEAVMGARIKIACLNIKDEFIRDQLETILFDAQCQAGQAALDCFNDNKE